MIWQRNICSNNDHEHVSQKFGSVLNQKAFYKSTENLKAYEKPNRVLKHYLFYASGTTRLYLKEHNDCLEVYKYNSVINKRLLMVPLGCPTNQNMLVKVEKFWFHS